MKLLGIFCLIALTAGACAEADPPRVAQEENKTQAFAWVDFKQALDKAQASNKLILVDVYTDW